MNGEKATDELRENRQFIHPEFVFLPPGARTASTRIIMLLISCIANCIILIYCQDSSSTPKKLNILSERKQTGSLTFQVESNRKT